MSIRDCGVDGIATATSNLHIQAQSDIDLAIDINELKRRIERRDAENKRKDREITLLQKEVLSLTKDIHGLRDRNDQLQHSLTNARLLTAASREDAETRITNDIIVDLQEKLARNEKAMNRTLGDLEEARATNSALETQLREAVADGEVKAGEISRLKEECYTGGLKTKTLNIRIDEKSAESEKLRVACDQLTKSEKVLRGELEQQKTTISEHERTIAELRTDNKRMAAANLVKQETNSLLRDQMTDISQNSFVVSKEEFDKFKDMERNLSTGQARNQDLVKSVELHMDLLQRAETEANALKVKLENAEAQIADLKEEALLVAQTSSSSANTFAAMKKEVVKLRKENKLFAERIDELLAKRRDGTIAEGDAGMRTVTVTPSHTTSTANQIRASQVSQEDRGEERRKWKLMEEANHALRNRISFLLEQMDQASKLSVTWKEQKSLLKSQINSLHQANIDLRERLVNVQRNFMEKTLYEIDHPSFRRNAVKSTRIMGDDTDDSRSAEMYDTNPGMQTGNSDRFNGYTSEEGAERMLTHASPGILEREGGTRNLMETAYRLDVATPLPNTVEGFVERRMFDVLCAFTTGDRSLLNLDEDVGKGKAVKKTKLKENFTVHLHTDGLFQIVLDRGTGPDIPAAVKAEAEELLVGLQIPAFLRFVQTRHPDKLPVMFTEKMATVLNFLRQTVQDYLVQLGESRMIAAKLQSKVSLSNQRVENMQHLFTMERVAKQKNVMKYVREQMRISDLRKVMDDISRIGRDNLDDIEDRRREIAENCPSSADSMVPDNRAMRGLLLQLKSVAEHLSATAAYNLTDPGQTSSPEAEMIVGALEIRLFESQIDDETLHSVVGLLCGALGNTTAVPGADSDEESNTVTMARTSGTSISKNDMMMASGLGIPTTGEKLTSASLLAKSFLIVQSNYTNRLLLLNLKDNVLTDISCKVLGSLVEKSHSLRMLDVRGNMISPVGAKMLFDATRRNSSVLYVTQRQNGFMIEGHRHIMGTAKERTGKNGKGIVGVRADEDLNDTLDIHTRLVDDSANREAAATKKHPLRIDIRHNNPEQEAVERLLESTEFGARAGYHEGDTKPKNIMATTAAYATNYDNFAETVPPPIETRQQFGNYTTVASPQPRETGRMFESSSQALLSTPADRLRRYENQDLRMSGSAMTRPHTASADRNLPPRGASGAGIRRPMSSSGLGGRNREVSAIKSSSPFLNGHGDHSRGEGGGGRLPDIGSDSDEEKLYGRLDRTGDDDEDDDDDYARDSNGTQYVSSRLAERRKERVEGTGGTAVGSLLDNEIRRMQADRATDPSTGYAEGVGRKKRLKSAKRATVARKGIPGELPSTAERHLGMRNVYNNPVVKLAGGSPAATPSPKPFTHRTDNGLPNTAPLPQSANKAKSKPKVLLSKTTPSSRSKARPVSANAVRTATGATSTSYSHINPGMLF